MKHNWVPTIMSIPMATLFLTNSVTIHVGDKKQHLTNGSG